MFGQTCTFACDTQCDKAFGISGREKVSLSDDEDDYRYLTDGELGQAPQCTGTWEGGHGNV